MTTLKANLQPIAIQAGVQPSTDMTAMATPHYTMADKIRFRFGFPQKIGGWTSVLFNYGATIMGKARSLFSTVLSTSYNTLIGTNTNLYALSGSTLTNITPLQAATIALANNPIATLYLSLSNNPIATTNGSSLITVEDANAVLYSPGDLVTISGSTAVNGLTTGNINTSHVISNVLGSSHYTILTVGTANATGSGGGAGVIAASSVIEITAAAHGLSNGDRVKIAGATATGGIGATAINSEFIIRDITVNTFYVLTATTATSAAFGGGAGVTYRTEIADGNANQSVGQGYGMGLYGTSLYGTARQSSGLLSYPRIWFMDRFGSNVIMTAGNQTGLYSWAGSTTVAPALVSGAPAAINYSFVSNNIVVTFGAGGTINRIFSSDQANMNQWVASSTNQVFDYTVNGAGQLKSHVPVNGGNLIFTDYQTYSFRYLGFNAGTAVNGIWAIELLENNIGIIGPMARCAVGGIAYWMSRNNFYRWAGGNVEIIPANSQEESTILNYVFKNINLGQSSKCFAWYNEQFNEVWFHYPSAGSNEPDRVARYCRSDNSWVPDTFDRLCAEYPNLTLGYPRLIDSSGVLYAHEQGMDADGAAMPWSLTSNLRSGGGPVANSSRMATKATSILTGFVPDSVQTGDIGVDITGQLYPQSQNKTFDESYTVSPTTDMVPVEIGGRFWQYTLSGNAVSQKWTGGQWMEYVQGGPNQ